MIHSIYMYLMFLGSESKESACNMRDGFNPWVAKSPWRREWPPTPVFVPGEFPGQRSLLGYSPWGRRESDMTERLTLFFTFTFLEHNVGFLLSLFSLVLVPHVE